MPAKLTLLFALTAVVVGCAPDAELAATKVKLAEANKRIAALEAQLAPPENVKSAPSTPLSPPEMPVKNDVNVAAVESGPTGQWRYAVDEDPMSGSKLYTAVVKSTNSVSFGFPYAGEQKGTFMLRAKSGGKKDVMFYIERGQILCPAYQGCSALVRFDDDKPVRFKASGPSDHSSETIFLADYGKFLARLKKANRVRLAIEIYQNGAPAFEFDVSGFDPEQYQPKS